jgi:uncharacterized membrane protein YfcA
MSPTAVVILLLLLLAAGFAGYWFKRASAASGKSVTPGAGNTFIGFFTNFFDTLGIGSFATTTTIFRLLRRVDDQNIPGTLNVGHAIPTVAQAWIYTTLVEVDFLTLALLIMAAVGGSWIGAAIVSGLPKAAIQRGMGIALLLAAVLMVMTALNRMPGGGEATALRGGALILACGINFALGALMTLGIGLYAPCMIMVSLMGMNPTVAFPIMMGSCAFLMPVAGMQFINTGRYDLRAALGLTLGGVPAVLLAAFLVRSLPLTSVRWLVVLVVIYTAVMLLRSAGAPEPARTAARATD